MQSSFIDRVSAKVALIEKIGLKREVEDIYRIGPTRLAVGNKFYTSFACNDYFGLSTHPDVKQASAQAALAFGTSASASRIVSGNHPLYSALEKKLAEHYGTESALIFSSGFTANMGSLAALLTKKDLVIADQSIHACMSDGIKLSEARFLKFNHNNIKHCEELLLKNRNNFEECFIVSESIYSMKGDIAPIKDLKQLCKKYNANLYIDNAHGFGVVDLIDDSCIISGSLSKGLGSIGGYVCTTKLIRDFLINRSKSFMFTTGLPPSSMAAALKAYELYPEQAKKLIANQKLFEQKTGIKIESHIVPIETANSEESVIMEKKLRSLGFIVKAIRPPTVRKAMLRIVLNAEHSENTIMQFIEAANNLLFKSKE